MDCTAAEPFVSIIYDGEGAPLEAVQHFTTCASCRARLEDYARITSAMRMLAAEGQSPHAVKVPPLPPRSGWLQVWSQSVRIPRVAAAVFLLALAVVTVGWIHTAAQNKETLAFWCEVKAGTGTGGGSLVEVGEPDTNSAFNGDQGFASTVEALSISDRAVVLRVRFKYFSRYVDPDQVSRELANIAPREITYIPGQQISIPVEGGGPVLLSGHVVRGGDEVKPVGAAALVPAPDEIALASPVLIRDDREVLAVGGAVVRRRCKSPQCGVSLYVPEHGLFFFSTQPLDNGIQGISGMSQVQFEEDGHTYLLCSAIPVTGGDQPRSIWILHIKDYLPSQHRGGAKSSDGLVSVGMGDLSGYLAPR